MTRSPTEQLSPALELQTKGWSRVMGRTERVLLKPARVAPKEKLMMEMVFPASAPEGGGKGMVDGVVTAVEVAVELGTSAETAARTVGRANTVLVKARSEVRMLVESILKMRFVVKLE
jgi:hypothetical protein